MAGHTTFRVGGPADFYAVPLDADDLGTLFAWCARWSVPRFILGGGANIVVSDRGIRGLVIDMRRFDVVGREGCTVRAGAGCDVSKLVETTAAMGLTGLEFLYAMPGTLGGALWMNARCYGTSLSDRITASEFMHSDGTVTMDRFTPEEWGYKRSPFQKRAGAILGAELRLEPGDPAKSREIMEGYRRDREEKGHFSAPSAGSVFKNDRRLGAPTGKILDDLQLRGTRMGGAQVSPRHANIIINTGDASAADIRALVIHLQTIALNMLGLKLEPEIRFVGEWEGV